MNSIICSFQNSELALAAYAKDLLPGGLDKQALKDAGLADLQAATFASTYTVQDQYNAANGLSATVFADGTGQTYLAIRGTDPEINDVLTDVIDIALLGTPAFQAQCASLKTRATIRMENGALGLRLPWTTGGL